MNPALRFVAPFGSFAIKSPFLLLFLPRVSWERTKVGGGNSLYFKACLPLGDVVKRLWMNQLAAIKHHP
jgi:hypothetical protein